MTDIDPLLDASSVTAHRTYARVGTSPKKSAPIAGDLAVLAPETFLTAPVFVVSRVTL